MKLAWLVRSAHVLRRLWIVFVMLSVALVPVQTAQAQQGGPVATGVFFFSPACPHCHEVLDNHWPGIEAQYGDALQVVFVDVSMEEGALIMRQTLAYLGLPSSGVPLLVIGDEVMVGSLEIPERAPQVIDAALAAGGVALPPIPALAARLDAQLLAQAPKEIPAAAPDSADAAGAAVVDVADSPAQALVADSTAKSAAQGAAESAAVSMENPRAGESVALPAVTTSVLARITRDPVGNGVAILVLLLLVASLLLFALYRLSKPAVRAGQSRRQTDWRAAGLWLRTPVLIATALGGVALAVSILSGALASPVVAALAVVQFLSFLTVGGVLLFVPSEKARPSWLVIVAAAAGMLVAIYLAYVEGTANPAVCGAVGDCNTVQQSQYASLLGIPIGMLGVAGYLFILAVALLDRWMPALLGSYGAPLLEAAAVGGVAFSIWLTFLEPFVIGATCAWCLLSALWMLAIFWLVTRWGERVATTQPHRAPKHKPGRPHAGKPHAV